MQYRKLGKTDLLVSEIGLGGEWLERHNEAECVEIINYCEKCGINILDCWMCEPNVRSNIGKGIKNNREHWIIQGHLGSTWNNGQYLKTRDVDKVKIAFNDLLERLGTDYIDLGMVHYIDDDLDYEKAFNGPFIDYVKDLKKNGVIRHIGLSTHNPHIAKRAVLDGLVEMILFSINPAFDLLPANEDLNNYFSEEYDNSLNGINIERKELYQLCEKNNVGITVMKGYAGGRLFDAKTSVFKVALTPVQCLHYALTRPAVASVMVGFDSVKHVNDAIYYYEATDDEKDYASVLANCPNHSYSGDCTYCGHCQPCPKRIDIAMVNKLYDLALMQDDVPISIKNHYFDLEATAKDCIECGGCESRCPFKVKIIEKMRLAKKLFK